MEWKTHCNNYSVNIFLVVSLSLFCAFLHEYNCRRLVNPSQFTVVLFSPSRFVWPSHILLRMIIITLSEPRLSSHPSLSSFHVR